VDDDFVFVGLALAAATFFFEVEIVMDRGFFSFIFRPPMLDITLTFHLATIV
jgi:hypothetical protein